MPQVLLFERSYNLHAGYALPVLNNAEKFRHDDREASCTVRIQTPVCSTCHGIRFLESPCIDAGDALFLVDTAGKLAHSHGQASLS